MEAALSLRYDAFEAKLARLGEHDPALGGQRFLEHDSADRDKPRRLLAHPARSAYGSFLAHSAHSSAFCTPNGHWRG
jgi:hypothetical protein